MSPAVAPLGRVQRKTLLYRSGLGFDCINHVQGCSHGCRYPCYAFMMAKHHGRTADYGEWCRPRLVDHALELLHHELRGKRRRISRVHLCLTTDPFMADQPEVVALSLELIALLNRHRISCSLLTKGILPAELADRGRFPCDNAHGISLVSIDERFRRTWEPRAAPYADRIAALRRLHEAGRRTLVHMEPYPTPNIQAQDISVLLASVSFVDHVFFGAWNYSPLVRNCPDAKEFYRAESGTVQRFCRAHGIELES